MYLRGDSQRGGSQDAHPSSTLPTYLVINIYPLTSHRDSPPSVGLHGKEGGPASATLAGSPGAGSLPWGNWKEGPRHQALRLWLMAVGIQGWNVLPSDLQLIARRRRLSCAQLFTAEQAPPSPLAQPVVTVETGLCINPPLHRGLTC